MQYFITSFNLLHQTCNNSGEVGRPLAQPIEKQEVWECSRLFIKIKVCPGALPWLHVRSTLFSVIKIGAAARRGRNTLPHFPPSPWGDWWKSARGWSMAEGVGGISCSAWTPAPLSTSVKPFGELSLPLPRRPVWKNAARPWMLIVERSVTETREDYLTRSLRMQRLCANKATCSNPRNPLIVHFLFSHR